MTRVQGFPDLLLRLIDRSNRNSKGSHRFSGNNHHPDNSSL
jgi:hypothetical protein